MGPDIRAVKLLIYFGRVADKKKCIGNILARGSRGKNSLSSCVRSYFLRVSQKSNNPLTTTPTDKDGFILPSDETPVYLVIETEDGDELFAMSTNIPSMAHLSAQCTSLGESDLFAASTNPELESCRIINGDTHKALCRYKAGEGLQEDWKENDPERVQLRSEHISSETYMPFPGKKLIGHSQ